MESCVVGYWLIGYWLVMSWLIGERREAVMEHALLYCIGDQLRREEE
ncbi:MAG: hypothetical protein ACTSUE_11825 [Promethearchaeota archaeon]